MNALRSHDDRFNAMVNKIALNKQKPNKQTGTPSVTIGRPGLGANDGEAEAQQIENAEIARQLELRFGEIQDGMYAKLVENAVTVFIGRIGQKRSVLLRTNLLSVFPNLFSPAYTKRLSMNI